MEFRTVGSSGLRVSLSGLGGNNFGPNLDEQETCAVVHAALDVGVTFFDTADSYGDDGRSETLLGKALAGHRDEVVIATKFGTPLGSGVYEGGGSRRYIVRAVEASLRRLGTDWIDLYQMHYPDSITPIAETLAALDDLVHAGKVRYVGSSNLLGWQIADADWIARTAGTTPFISAQNEWNLLDTRLEREVLPACKRFGIGMFPYHPLASGVLTGKYTRGAPPQPGFRLAKWEYHDHLLNDENFDAVDRLVAFAAEHGRTVGELALAWLAAHQEVSSVIAGATTPEQVRANAAALEWELDTDTVYEAVFAVRGTRPAP